MMARPKRRNSPYPDNPVDLVKARFQAYKTGNRRFLLDSWSAETRPETIELGVKWTYLELRWSETIDDDHVLVEFVAFHEKGQMKANSEFVREGGKWFYLGEVPNERT